MSHRLIVNTHGQYSLWNGTDEIPTGWRDVGVMGTRAECLARVEALWADAPSPSAAVAEGPTADSLVARWAVRTPDAEAVRCGDRALTYAALDALASRVASALRARGVTRGARVGLAADRTIETIAALLGILKAGAAFVPLDLQYPQPRIDAMIADAGLAVIATTAAHAARFAARSLVIDACPAGPAPAAAHGAGDPAYIIYTSGSTGAPKGVVVEHGSLVNYAESAARVYGISPADRVMQFSSLTFDASLEEIFVALASGATLVLRDDAMLATIGTFIERVDALGITVLGLPTAFWHELADRIDGAQLALPAAVRLVIIGGERVSAAAVRRWQKAVPAATRLVNTYGPTEATIVATACDVAPLESGDDVPIGEPVAGARITICDESLRALPDGEEGELCIGGPGVARGYLGSAALTCERFVADPFGGPGARLYRTGDRAVRIGGRLQFRGRVDRQVKLRGFRVELGEVEASLERGAMVARAAVVVRADRRVPRITAYVTPAAADALRSELEDERVTHWRGVHDTSVAGETAPLGDPAFNFEGWNSSFTGRPIQDAEMREWADGAAARIVSRLPAKARILEIGCGTGLLLFRVAPHCGEYVGIDFSPGTLGYVRHVLATRDGAPRNVTLLERTADDLAGLPAESFDAVVLNSVVQYFPSEGYLRRVLHGAARLVRNNGFIFVGDVRSLALSDAFHSAVALAHASDQDTAREIRVDAERRMRDEEELLLDPAAFAVAGFHTAIEPKRGRGENEMNWFRYDVTLRRTEAAASLANDAIPAGELSLDDVRLLMERGPAQLTLLDVPNARVASMIASARLLRDEAELTAAALRVRVPQGGGIDPRDLEDLGARLGYTVAFGSLANEHGRFDVRFVRGAGEPVAAPRREAGGRVANDPLWHQLSLRMFSSVRADCAEHLPEFMRPAEIVVLPALPSTSSGKIDYAALPAPGTRRSAGAGYVAPRNEMEEQIARVWEALLGVDGVGVDDPFFDLGGNSLLAIQMASRLSKAIGAEVTLDQIFRAGTVAALAAAMAAPQRDDRRRVPPAIARQPRNKKLPVCFAQQAMWIASQMAPESVPYNNQVSIRLAGPLDVGILSHAFTEIVRRHEIFRTSFSITDEGVMQQIHDPWTVTIDPIDVSHLPPADREPAAEQLIAAEVRKPFDLRSYPLLRWTLIRIAAEDHVLVQVDQHFGHDGWSLALLMRDLTALYDAFARGEASPLPDPSIQFADFAVWQREWLQGDVLEAELVHWRDKLEGAMLSLQVPTDRPRPKNRTFRGATHRQIVPAPLAAALRELSRREGVSLFMTMLAAFDVLLLRYTGQDDILIGSAFANRTQPGTEQLIGMMANAVVLRNDLSGNPSFRDLLRRVEAESLDAYAHQLLPFESLVEDYHHNRDNSRNPLFQVMFSFHDAPMPELKFGGVTGTLQYRYNGSAKFDLDVTVIPNLEEHSGLRAVPGQERMLVEWEYSAELYDPSTIARLSAHFEGVLRAVAVDARQRVGELPILRDADRRLLAQWQGGDASNGEDDVCARFERQAVTHPDRIAAVAAEQRVTYGELNRRANRLAHALVARGVGRDVVVAVHVHRSIEFLTAVLGIWKAGAAYLPLDLRDPQQRMRGVLRQSGVRLIVCVSETMGSLEDAVRDFGDARPELLDVRRAVDAAARESEPAIERHGRDLAYVIYTSGSTGVPKGAMVEHAGMLNHLLAKIEDLAIGEDDVVAQTASQTFDISVWQFIAPLLTGGRTHILADEIARDPQRMVETLARNELTIVEVVPAMLRAMLQHAARRGAPRVSSLRWMIATGEPLPPGLVRQWLELYPDIPVVNAYGPTECSDDVTHHVIRAMPADGDQSVPIGRALRNVTIHVLDQYGNLVPPGVAGELCVSGICVGRGYLNDPVRTAEVFVSDPFAPTATTRMYRTGDLGRQLADGTLQYLGRRDQQIKIRGFRIEIGEVEAAIALHPLVREVAVKGVYNAAGELQLIAFVVLTEGGTEGGTEGSTGGSTEGNDESLSKIRSALWERVPEFMLPAFFVTLDALPLTENGKVDRKALPDFDVDRMRREAGMVPARTPIEHAIGDIWTQMLTMPAISVHANFFELGGHSLLATQMLSRLRERFAIDLPLSTVFDAPTIARLAERIESATRQAVS